MTRRSRLLDAALEASVVGSFSRVGYDLRRRLDHWEPLTPRPGATALVTGATSGIGLAAAIGLARLGFAVRFVGRRDDRARRARERIVAASANPDVDYVLADLAELASVREAAAWVNSHVERLDVLVHNAGAITPTRTLSGAGVEVTVAAQLLGPFLLTRELDGALSRGEPGRVVTVSSGGLYTQRFDLEALEGDRGEYDGVAQYARVKRAQVVLTREWARRLDPTRVVAHAMHPGWVDTPGMREALPGFSRTMGPWLRTPDQGADTVLWLASASVPGATSGALWHDRRRRHEHAVPWTRSRDPLGDQARLWEWCRARVA
ncbi:MAG: SDR family NAD(P)-dependent oxidoreductase [Acidimicrobiales bacterium]